MAFEEDEVGAIDTGDESAGLDTPRRAPPQEDNSGMGPVGAIDTGDDSGMGPVAAGGAAPAPQEERTGPNGPIMRQLKAFPGNARRIVAYLMGEGAADPMQLQQAAAAVDPEGRMSQDDRNVVAIQKVAQEQGPEAAWKLVQANRVAYNAKQAFAYTALNGTPQKRPDLGAAIDAANQAASHVLDGSTVQFAPGQGGITATVSGPGGQPQTYQLSIDQFRRYLNVGGEGQYDKVMQRTVPQTLASLAQGGGAGQDRISQLRPLPKRGATPSAPQEPGEADSYVPPSPKSNFGKTPSTQNLSGSDDIRVNPKTPVEETNYGDELEARAQRMFPSASQERERNQWMAQEEQRLEAAENRVNVAKAGAEGKVGAAQAAAGGRVQAEGVKADASRDTANIKAGAWRYASDSKRATEQIKADAKAAHEGNVEARARLEAARKSIAAKRATLQPLTKEEEAFEKQLNEVGTKALPMGGQRQGAPQQAPQQQAPANPGQPPEPGAKFYKGSWYRRGPNGEAQRIQ